MSDTPRTDQAWKTTHSVYEFIAEMKRMERELNAANDRIKRLEECGDWLSTRVGWGEREQWNKAKEAKP